MSFVLNWLGQGGFLMYMDGQTLAVDPYLSDSVEHSPDRFERLVPIPVEPEALGAHLVLLTHDHLDHLDPDTLSRVSAPAYAGPESCLSHLRALGKPESSLRRLARGDSLDFGSAVLTGVYAKHTADAIGLLVEQDGVRAYFTADTLYDPALSEVGKVDLFVPCVNGKMGNMNAEEAARVAKSLPCRLAIPVHYGMFAGNTCDPTEFTRAAGKLGIPSFIAPFNEPVDVLALLRTRG